MKVERTHKGVRYRLVETGPNRWSQQGRLHVQRKLTKEEAAVSPLGERWGLLCTNRSYYVHELDELHGITNGIEACAKCLPMIEAVFV